ncbi:MAG: TetR/AcrR family transcriptional regulator [Planctomycetota bacterium]|nr:TetR/AcrR family transcriptional regulator [Planctomycetota bacterium]
MPLSTDPSTRVVAILETSKRLFAELGPWGLRISDIAKEVGISVGTFYTHFPSKEDLVQALARGTLKQRLETFEDTFQTTGLTCAEQVIVSVLRNFLYSFDHPSRFAIERFAISPAIWDASSDEARSATNDRHKVITECVRAQIERAIQEGSIRAEGECKAQSGLILVGVWTLASGSSQVALLRKIIAQETSTQRRLPKGFVATVQAYMIGAGWSTEDPAGDMRRLAEIALAIPASQ